MTSLISTIPCLSGSTVYPFWAISVQSCLSMITMPSSSYNAKDMLTSSTIPSTTDQDKCARRSSLDSQALGIMNSSLAHNILMHGKENTEFLWTICAISMALLGLLLFLQTISTLDISRFLEIAALLPRLQNLTLFIPGWKETNVMSSPSFVQWHFYLLFLNLGITWLSLSSLPRPHSLS